MPGQIYPGFLCTSGSMEAVTPKGQGRIDVYDGANLARRGLIVVTVNYRPGALGFLALPQLSAESSHHVSGNYGFLDGVAALQ